MSNSIKQKALEAFEEIFYMDSFETYRLGVYGDSNCNSLAREILQAIDSVPQWEPIETAPQTSKAILVYCSKLNNVYSVYWDYFPDGGWVHFGGWRNLEEIPTHWMPMPEAPKEADNA